MSKAVAVEEKVLLVEEKPPIAWLKLNRPKVHNCLNREILRSIVAACDELRERRDIRVVCVIGSGAKVFCAGADLAERKGLTEGETLDYLALINKAMRAVEELPQPVIAAINGPAFGGGTELALSCDLRVMFHDASLRLTEVKLGIIPGAGGTQRLPRLIGKSKAKEMILTAAPISAPAGEACGLIHRVVQRPESEELVDGFSPSMIEAVSAWALEIAEAAPLSLRQAKQAIDLGFDRDLDAGLAIETRAYLALMNTADRQEGLKAFAEKRKPVYRGE